LAAAVRCFPALRELIVNDELVRKVPESEWLRLMKSGQLAQLRALSWTAHDAWRCECSDRWLSAVCMHLPRRTHLELGAVEALVILANAERLRRRWMWTFRRLCCCSEEE
jgi:hypothetical protein